MNAIGRAIQRETHLTSISSAATYCRQSALRLICDVMTCHWPRFLAGVGLSEVTADELPAMWRSTTHSSAVERVFKHDGRLRFAGRPRRPAQLGNSGRSHGSTLNLHVGDSDTGLEQQLVHVPRSGSMMSFSKQASSL